MSATATTTDVQQIVDRYIEAWNESHPEARRDLITRTWTGAGHASIDAMIAAAQPQFEGLRFRRTSVADAHHDVVRFSWALGLEGSPALAGVDVGVVADGRFRSIAGFFDFMPGTGEQ